MRTMAVGLSFSVAFVLSTASAGDRAEVEALIDKVVKAAGGEAKVNRLKLLTAKAKMTFSQNGMDVAVTLDAAWEGWDKARLDADVQAGGMNMQALLVMNGPNGWTKDANRKRPFPKEVFPMVMNAFDAFRMPQLLPMLKNKDAFKLNHLGEVKVGEQTAIGMSVSRRDRPDINIFFDKQNHLPIKSEVRLMDPNNQEINLEYHFSEYRDFDGLRAFSRVTMKGVPGVEVVVEITELQTRDQLDPALFNEPD